MNDQNRPTDPHHDPHTDSAWEAAMSRDFDARVRNLHEAPLDFDSVKGKARKIRRNRRAAVAGGVLGAAAVIAPIAVLAGGNLTDDDSSPPAVNDPTPSETIADPTAGIDYVEGRAWHQADGDTVQIGAGDYYQAGVWNDSLVALESGVEVTSVLSIFDADGTRIGQLEDIVGFAISADGTILSYTTGDGDLIARWDGGEEVLATDVTDTGGGESIGGAPVAVTGSAPCVAESGSCLVRINSYENGCRGVGSSDVPAPVGALACGDEQDDLLVYTTEYTDTGYPCAGIGQGSERTLLWPATCDYDLQDISPDGQYVVGGQIDSDGLGPKTVSVLDVATGDVVSTYAAPTQSSFLWSDIAWSTSGQLLVSQWDAGEWTLLAIDPATGEPVEIAGPVAGDEVSNPFLVLHH